MKNAGKACNNRLYRHIRTFEKIVKNYFVISLKKITKCCIVRFLQLFYFLYILKNIFRNSSSLFFRIFSLHF